MLLEIVAKSFPKTRIRFTTSNPQDIDSEVLETMARYNNICNHHSKSAIPNAYNKQSC